MHSESLSKGDGVTLSIKRRGGHSDEDWEISAGRTFGCADCTKVKSIDARKLWWRRLS